MKKLNNKGFTLIEVMAVVVILSIIMAIMIPNVNYLIEDNKNKNYEDLKRGIIQATRVLFSDYRYEVVLSQPQACSNITEEKNISKVGDTELTASKVPIKLLVDKNNISVNKEGIIEDPRDKTKKLDLGASYVLVKYQCSTKDFTYTLEDTQLIWKKK